MLFDKAPNFLNHKYLLMILRKSNLCLIFPNFFMYFFLNKDYEHFDFVDVQDQTPKLQFLLEQYSSNYLANSGGLVLIYMTFGILNYIVRNCMNSNDTVQKQIKYSFKNNIFIFIFMNTVQEEFLLCLLQFDNIKFTNFVNITGFILAVISSIHIIFMLAFLIK